MYAWPDSNEINHLTYVSNILNLVPHEISFLIQNYISSADTFIEREMEFGQFSSQC